MILECSITNFRSINKKQTFSMLASSARSKGDNIFEITLLNEDVISLIKTAAIYGANASGKSNFIRAFFQIILFVAKSDKIAIDKDIPAYDSFLFNSQSINQPTEFEIIFISKEKIKYLYKIAFNKNEITEEYLYDFPNKKRRNLFKRGQEKSKTDNNIHIGKLGKEFRYKKYNVYKNLPFLSLFGKAENYHTNISPAFLSLTDFEIWNIPNFKHIFELKNKIKEDLQKPEYLNLLMQLEKLIVVCDTQIQSLVIDENVKVKEEYEIENKIQTRYNEVLFAKHKVFKDKEEINSHNLPFSQESLGTNQLFALGGLILQVLNEGGVIFFDEFDSSLHPHLSRFLVSLFHNPLSNPKNAQLIFTTHTANLLDKEMFRADQIWFTEKNEFGETELFSAQEFEGVREDIPFDKWYLAGKFGAIPNIKEIDFIYNKDINSIFYNETNK